MSAPDTDPVPAEPAALNAAAAAGEQTPRRARWKAPVLLTLLAAVAIIAWQWYDTRSRIESIRAELGQRLRASDGAAAESRALAKEALDAAREAQGKLSVLENKLAESQSQQVALEALYQDLSRGRDEWVLAEIEQMLTIASQHLQLSGNVQAALLALRTAEGRLARSDRPQYLPLRRALNRDIERLKAVPNLDITGLALRLDQLIAGVDHLPLQFDRREAGDAPRAPVVEPSMWARVLAEAWNEMLQLVRIRVIDQPDAALLSPSQAYFLRQNLQLRLLDARQALLARDAARFRADLETARAWLTRYYDKNAKATQAAQTALRQMASAAIDAELPSIDASINAVRNFKFPRERSAR